MPSLTGGQNCPTGRCWSLDVTTFPESARRHGSAHHEGGAHAQQGPSGRPGLAGILLSLGPASAHPVGEPDTPSCFGERISHGSSDPEHLLTPKERAAALQELVDAGFPEAVELFGETVTVREFADFVRTNCSDTPYVP